MTDIAAVQETVADRVLGGLRVVQVACITRSDKINFLRRRRKEEKSQRTLHDIGTTETQLTIGRGVEDGARGGVDNLHLHIAKEAASRARPDMTLVRLSDIDIGSKSAVLDVVIW